MKKLVGLLLSCCACLAIAAEPTQTRVLPGAVTSSTRSDTHDASVAQQSRDLMQARMWGLDLDEIKRAEQLMAGPRGAFSVANISPIEVLGIHARTEAERQKYAELMARATYEDVQRVLAFQAAYDAAMRRLYPNSQVVNVQGKQLPRGFFKVQK